MTWRYLKVYLRRDRQDGFLGRLLPAVVEAAAPRQWFFVRYSDDAGDHLRIRLEVSGETARWVRCRLEAISDRVTTATYRPETRRYGGPAAMDAVHQIFTADSDGMPPLLRRPAAEERPFLVIASADDLLSRLGHSATDRHEIYQRQADWLLARLCPSRQARRRALDQAERTFRRLAPTLATAHATLRTLPHDISAHDRLGQAGETLAALTRSQTITRDLREIAIDLQHMHFNRGGITLRQEMSAVLLLLAWHRRDLTASGTSGTSGT